MTGFFEGTSVLRCWSSCKTTGTFHETCGSLTSPMEAFGPSSRVPWCHTHLRDREGDTPPSYLMLHLVQLVRSWSPCAVGPTQGARRQGHRLG